jgi:phage baseplate assembly protein W
MASLLPTTGSDLDLMEFEEILLPSYGYNLDIDRNRVRGMNDAQEAVRQAIYLILNTERYMYGIYSQNYGCELTDLIGRPLDYAMSEAKRRIIEALLADDRITAVDGFEFQHGKNSLTVTFIVHTIFGDVNTETEVQVA